jgi:uncharacterized protein (TIGR00725 family)
LFSVVKNFLPELLMGVRRTIIGVMGPGDEGGQLNEMAFVLGQLIARAGWILLTGGRRVGVMDAANRGAKTVPGSITVGVLPGDYRSDDVSDSVDIAIFTGMGDARNVVNVLSSDVVVACGAATPGTASEIALGLKSGRSVILLAPSEEAAAFFIKCGGGRVDIAQDPAQVITMIQAIGLKQGDPWKT